MSVQLLHDLGCAKVLLGDVGLVHTDLAPDSKAQLFGVYRERVLVATAGLEVYGEWGLMRSLAVAPAHRGQGLAIRLVRYIELQAVRQGVRQLALLTCTAEELFLHQGYARWQRQQLPPDLQRAPQFLSLCPASATALGKTLV